MKYIDHSPKHPFVNVLIADGKYEVRILNRVVQKFQTDNVSLFSPATPLGGQKGLVSVLNVLKVLTDKFSNSNFLIVIDREHVSNTAQIMDEVKKFGIVPMDEDKTEYYFKAKVGQKMINVYVTIQGMKKNIEEEVSILIQQTYAQEISPDKDKIRDFLNTKNKNVESLIDDSNLPKLKKSFPCLIQVLECISNKHREV